MAAGFDCCPWIRLHKRGIGDVDIVTLAAARATFERLIERVQRGEYVAIARDGSIVAELVPYPGSPRRRVGGLWRGNVQIAPDFDDPVPGFDDAVDS